MKQFLSVLLLAVLFTGFINAQSKMAFGLQAGVAIPLGDFGDGYDLGFGGQGTFAYHINPMFDVTGSVGYLTWSGKADGVTFSSVPVLVGVRYYFGQDQFHPYISGELGMHFTSSKVEFLGNSYTSSDSFFGFGVGAGFLYKLGPNLDLDVNAKFNSISSEGSASNYVGIMAGVLIAL
ncbi:MAG TPA: hypothetical protein DHV28_12975 [Ignavibacteriales bacterium]|nr:hypothetical protein [Ignavibacteriales bacterium]